MCCSFVVLYLILLYLLIVILPVVSASRSSLFSHRCLFILVYAAIFTPMFTDLNLFFLMFVWGVSREGTVGPTPSCYVVALNTAEPDNNTPYFSLTWLLRIM